MTYKIKYEEEADVLTLILKEKDKLSHANEFGDVVVHVDENGEPLFLEILRAAKLCRSWSRDWRRKKSPLRKASF